MLGGTEDAYVREVSFVHPATRKMTMYSVNLSLSRAFTAAHSLLRTPGSSELFPSLSPSPPSEYLTVLESIAYVPSATAPTTETTFTQTAEIQARGNLWKSVGEKLEIASLQRFVANAASGKKGFEDVLHRLFGDDSDEIRRTFA